MFLKKSTATNQSISLILLTLLQPNVYLTASISSFEFADFVDMSESDSGEDIYLITRIPFMHERVFNKIIILLTEFLEDDGTQNYVVQENPAVFTGSLSVTAAPDEGQNQEPFHQDGSVSPPGSPNWSEAPAGDFRPDSPAAAAINDEPGEAAGQPEPPQIQTWIPDLRPPRYVWVNHSRSPGSRLAKPKASARRGRTRPTLGVAPRREVQTTMVALKNQRRGSVRKFGSFLSPSPVF